MDVVCTGIEGSGYSGRFPGDRVLEHRTVASTSYSTVATVLIGTVQQCCTARYSYLGGQPGDGSMFPYRGSVVPHRGSVVPIP